MEPLQGARRFPGSQFLRCGAAGSARIRAMAPSRNRPFVSSFISAIICRLDLSYNFEPRAAGVRSHSNPKTI